MKKIVVGAILAGLLVVGANAQEGYGQTQKQRIESMQKMAQAMNDIQSGFFYNNYDIIKAGVSDLVDSVREVTPPLEASEAKDVQDIMKRMMNDKIKMTSKVVKKIDQKALTLLQRFKAGDTEQAVQAYTKITKECIRCHLRVRKW